MIDWVEDSLNSFIDIKIKVADIEAKQVGHPYT